MRYSNGIRITSIKKQITSVVEDIPSDMFDANRETETLWNINPINIDANRGQSLRLRHDKHVTDNSTSKRKTTERGEWRYRFIVDCSHDIKFWGSTKNKLTVEFFRATDHESSVNPFFIKTITPTTCNNEHFVTLYTTSHYNWGFVRVTTDGSDAFLVDKARTELCYYSSSQIDPWGDCEITYYGKDNHRYWCLTKGLDDCIGYLTSNTLVFVHEDSGSWNKGEVRGYWYEV